MKEKLQLTEALQRSALERQAQRSQEQEAVSAIKQLTDTLTYPSFIMEANSANLTHPKRSEAPSTDSSCELKAQ